MSVFKLIQGDCLEAMAELPENSVDAVITDPPYEIGFMNKGFDKTGIAHRVETWRQAARVLKPGGYLLAFSGTRTYHRMGCAIEDAGLEIRDVIDWVYGSGFPKSMDIGKAVDKSQGNKREELGRVKRSGKDRGRYGKFQGNNLETKGSSAWEGWGTALKPAHEPICMARKPLSEKTVVENVLAWGTGGINVDGSRISLLGEKPPTGSGNPVKNACREAIQPGRSGGNGGNISPPLGRFPANLIHDGSQGVKECFPDTGKSSVRISEDKDNKQNTWTLGRKGTTPRGHDDAGGSASRFFKSIIYQAKAGKAERNGSVAKNFHPTVKPVALMEYLINMVTRRGAVVLDPFLGSGTTGVACANTGRRFIGVELDPNYFDIAEARILSAYSGGLLD